jgi:hypothetical protein
MAQQKLLTSTTLFFIGKRTLKRRGIGMLRMMRSEEMLKTAFVIKWFVAAEHCSDIISGSFHD